VTNENINVYTLNITSNEKTRLTNVDNYLVVSPENHRAFFDQRKPFDPMTILKSPMGIMIGMTLLMMFCMNNMPDMGK
jgi:hypothetical protein